MERVDTIVVGAGPEGLAASYFLSVFGASISFSSAAGSGRRGGRSAGTTSS